MQLPIRPFLRCTLIARKWLVFLPLPCLTPPLAHPLEFLDKTYLAKTKGMGLPYGEKNSTTQPTQIFTFAHSIVKHRQKSGFRRKENNRLYQFFGYFWSVFGIFRFLNTEVGIGVKNIGYRFFS